MFCRKSAFILTRQGGLSMRDHFPVLLLLARPGAGKSEVIHYLKNLTPEERLSRFHVGEILEIDDFPMLWTWFEEDDLLQQMGFPRLHSDTDGYFLGQHLWDLLIERICLDYHKLLRDKPDAGEKNTVLIEFSRGNEHGGYRSAFKHLSSEVLSNLAVIYLQVSWEESLRKNRKRFNPDKPDSILQHSLPDAKLERLYRYNDWVEVSKPDQHYLHIQGFRVPYAVMDNEDDVTTAGGDRLGNRLQDTCSSLWQKYGLTKEN